MIKKSKQKIVDSKETNILDEQQINILEHFWGTNSRRKSTRFINVNSILKSKKK